MGDRRRHRTWLSGVTSIRSLPPASAEESPSHKPQSQCHPPDTAQRRPLVCRDEKTLYSSTTPYLSHPHICASATLTANRKLGGAQSLSTAGANGTKELQRQTSFILTVDRPLHHPPIFTSHLYRAQLKLLRPSSTVSLPTQLCPPSCEASPFRAETSRRRLWRT